ncbi:MAG: hypothetical protein HQL76_18090 [Magnetococcales bacterium]|nr:hypothetical protein [Magnetococcales bacterium]
METIPDVRVERNMAVSTRIPEAGLIILRDGDPGEPDLALGGVGGAYYSHRVEIEMYVQHADAGARDVAFDALMVSVGEVLSANPTLGGLSFGMTIGQPTTEVEAVEGAPAIKTGIFEPVIEYETNAVWTHCGPTGPIQDPPSCGGSVTFVAADNLEAFQLVTLDQDARVVLADQSIGGNVLGMTLSSAEGGEAVQLQIFGPVINAGWNWDSVNSQVFLGLTGEPTQMPPTSGFLVVVGSSISEMELFINIEPAIQLL